MSPQRPNSSGNDGRNLGQVPQMTLPKVYREIGRRVARSPKIPSALADHIKRIKELTPAANANDPGAISQLREAYEALGRQAYEKFGDKAVSRDIAPHLAAALTREEREVVVESAQHTVQVRGTSERKRSRRAPLVLLSSAALVILVGGVAAFLAWPSGGGGRGAVNNGAASTGMAAANKSSSSPQAAGKRPSAVEIRPLSATPVSFTGKETIALESLLKAEGSSLNLDDPVRQAKAKAQQVAEEINAAITKFLEGYETSDDEPGVKAAVMKAARDWEVKTKKLADSLRDDPAIKAIAAGMPATAWKTEFEKALSRAYDTHSQVAAGLLKAAEDGQQDVARAFGGIADNGAPFRSVARVREQGVRNVLARASNFSSGGTARVLDARNRAIEELASSRKEWSRQTQASAQAVRSAIASAETEWKAEVERAESDLRSAAGESAAVPDARVSELNTVVQNHEREIRRVANEESRSLADVCRAVAAKLVQAVNEGHSEERFDRLGTQLASQIRAEAGASIERLREQSNAGKTELTARLRDIRDEVAKQRAAEEAERLSLAAKQRASEQERRSRSADVARGSQSSGRSESEPLSKLITRVSRGPDPDPGWAIQAMHRFMRARNLDTNNPLGKMFDAYQSGRGRWQDTDGSIKNMSSLGLSSSDWSSEVAIPAWSGSGANDEPLIHAQDEPLGTRVGFSPMEVIEGLLCSISFLVIDPNVDPEAAGLDFLAVQIEVYGGKRFDLETSRVIQDDTFVDLWSSMNRKRYTVSRWQLSSPVGHMTPQTYAPLLFEVLNNDPDFMLVENLKITLSPRFRKGCRQLCDQVMKLRKAQGQHGVPQCRTP